MLKNKFQLQWFDDPEPTPKYMVTENTFTCINGSVVNLTRNMTIKRSATGAIIGVDCEGTEIEMNDAIQNLIDAGVLVEIEEESAEE